MEHTITYLRREAGTAQVSVLYCVVDMETTGRLYDTRQRYTTKDTARRRQSPNTNQPPRLPPSPSHARTVQSSERTTNGTSTIHGNKIQQLAIGNLGD